MKLLIRHIELFASGASLLVTWAAAMLLTTAGASRWPAAAIAAIVSGLLSHLAIRLVRQRRGEARQAQLIEVQGILHTIIAQHRVFTGLLPRLPAAERLQAERACIEITHAVMAASDALQRISEDSAREWQVRYDDYRAGRAGVP